MAYNERIVLNNEEHPANLQDVKYLPVSQMPLKTQLVMFTYDDGVSITQSTKITGVNRHSGKRWYRWHTDHYYRFTVKTLKNGKNYLFLYNGKTKREISSLGNQRNYLGSIFLQYVVPICEKLIGPYPENMDVTSDIFFYYAKPAMIGKDCFDTTYAKELKVSFRLNTIQEITKKVFGGGRYRKDLVKAVSTVDTYHKVSICKVLSENSEVPTDWLVEYLKQGQTTFNDRQVTTLTTRVPVRHLRKILLDPSRYRVLDILRMADENTDWSGSTTAIHDRLVAERNNRMVAIRRAEEADFEKPFEYSEDVSAKLEDLWVNHGLRIAETPAMLAEWSSFMGNCISSYQSDARQGDTLLFGYYEDDKLVVNLEIINGKLIQLLGKYNRTVDEPLFYKLTDTLSEFNVLKSNDFSKTWGAPNNQLVF